MSNYKRTLTAEEHAELAELNEAVKQAINKRTAWLDDKVKELARFSFGDEIYDMSSGRLLGTVTDIQRWHRGHAEYDCSVDFFYTYKIAGRGNSYDNTSRQYVDVGTKKDYADKLLRDLEEFDRRGD